MDLDWVTLYDYISIFSKVEIVQKINKFYESFYPLKFKKSGQKSFVIVNVSREGFLGLISSYILKILFVLEICIEAQQQIDSIQQNKVFQEKVKLNSKLNQHKNIEVSLQLQKTVELIDEAYKVYIGKGDDKVRQKGFLQIKLICSLNRIFQFLYGIQQIKHSLDEEGYEKLCSSLKLFTYQVCQKSQHYIRLFPQMGHILCVLLQFFIEDDKNKFNFKLQNLFPQKVKKLFAIIPNKQKNIFINLGDQQFYQFLLNCGFQIPHQIVQNYFRSEEQINALIADQQDFIQSIIIPQTYRGKKQWKIKVTQQLVNLSIQKKNTGSKNQKIIKLMECANFRTSEDFPINFS